MTSRRPARLRLSLRARLSLLCLSLSVFSGGLLALAINVLISTELVSQYFRPPLILDLSSPTATDDMLAAQRAANDAADQAAHTIRLQSLVGFALLVVFAAGVCWWVAGRALRPVQQITAVARGLSQDTLDERIAFDGPHDELRTLAESLDAMIERLARAFDGQRLFVANASHELRTPLTVIRTATDVALGKPTRPEAHYRMTLATIDTAAQRSQRLLDSLLRLARIQHRRAGLEAVDLAAIARMAISPGADRGVLVLTDLTPAVVTGDENLLDLLLRNLVDNAMRYNVHGGWVAVHTTVHDDRGVLAVENTGPPVAEAQVANLIRAFHRGEPARTDPGEGFGLGLAIVEAIVHAHDGHLELIPRPDGGLLVTVSLATVSLATVAPATWSGE